MTRGGGEHAWIRALVRRLAADPIDRRVLVGPGDDAAVLRPGRRPLIVTTDVLVDGVHFRRAWVSLRALGARAFGINASDIAAMGGRPTAGVMAIEVPRGVRARELDALVAGFVAAARPRGAVLVGGNLARGPRLAVTVTLLGEAPGRIVTRTGARPGDGVWVTGRLGRTGAAVAALERGEGRSLPAVPDRVDAGVRLARVASAMIDVSDGLVQDLGHVCRASGVGANLQAAALPVAPGCQRRFGRRAPVVAATAGEDYELAVVVPRRHERRLARLGLACPITRVGEIVAHAPVVCLLDPRGRRIPLRRGGFDHLA